MDINGYTEKARAEGAMIVDVRTPDEYAEGHIEGAVNVPLEALNGIWKAGADEEKPLYLYCLSGGRAARAKARLEAQGFENVTNMGGIADWRGALEAARGIDRAARP